MKELKGTGISEGIVTGPARVLESVKPAMMAGVDGRHPSRPGGQSEECSAGAERMAGNTVLM